MGAVLNGLALAKVRPFGAGFLIFSDYGRPAIRLAALMEIPVVYVLTHDSIGVGEDGPTHQPVEQLASLRAIPGLLTFRPCDANEVAEAWRVAYIRLEGDADPAQEAALGALERAGHPVVRIGVADVYDVGQEFFRWEIATAVAGSVLGIDPFDQPDVEASKIETRKLTSEAERSGSLPKETPIWEAEGLRVFTDARNAEALRQKLGSTPSLAAFLRAHLGRLGPGDYFALLAYVEMNETHREVLQAARHAVRDGRRVATCLGFGPRFLHSTGQAYKGGPNTGVFLQVTCDDAADLPIPGQKYSFGLVKAAQARGDFQVLAERGRRVLRVQLGSDVGAGLVAIREAVVKALA